MARPSALRSPLPRSSGRRGTETGHDRSCPCGIGPSPLILASPEWPSLLGSRFSPLFLILCSLCAQRAPGSLFFVRPAGHRFLCSLCAQRATGSFIRFGSRFFVLLFFCSFVLGSPSGPPVLCSLLFVLCSFVLCSLFFCSLPPRHNNIQRAQRRQQPLAVVGRNLHHRRLGTILIGEQRL
jgi:hypothetical protein